MSAAQLREDHDALREDYDAMKEEHDTLMEEHRELQEAHDELKGWDTIDVKWKVDNWSERCKEEIQAYSQRDIPVAGCLMQLNLDFNMDYIGLWIFYRGGCGFTPANIGGTMLRIESKHDSNTIERTYHDDDELVYGGDATGWKNFAELDHINDPENGFIEDDSITISATIRAERVGTNEPQALSTLDEE